MTLTYDVLTYIRPDGTSINLSNPPYTVYDYDGFGIGEFEHTTVSPPGVHGEYWVDTRMSAKVLTVEFGYTGDGVSERQDSRREVVRLFNPILGPGTLRLEQVNGVTREISCILAESLPLPSSEFEGAGHYRTLVRFKSHGIPAFRDPTIQSVSVVPGAGPGNFTFPWTFPRVFAQSGFYSTVEIQNDGDIETPVQIRMNGPLVNPSFINNTSGKKISFGALTIPAGYSVFIDTDPDNYRVQVNGGDAWNLLTAFEFWDLVPGYNNITVDVAGTSGGVTSGTISWYLRYLGQ